MARSVLLMSDQSAGRLPDRCVLSGVPTDQAVHVTAVPWRRARWWLGVPGVVPLLALRGRSHRYRVALPVSAKVWRAWHRRHLVAWCAVAAGLAFVVAGTVRGNIAIAVWGGVVLLAAAAYRTRAAHNYWLTCRLDTARETITVEPTHTSFDEMARQLFERSLHRR
jgi:hypothetical protein